MLYDLHIFSKYVITLKFCQDLVNFLCNSDMSI